MSALRVTQRPCAVPCVLLPLQDCFDAVLLGGRYAAHLQEENKDQLQV